MLLRFVTSITLVPAYLAEIRFNDSVENTDITLPNFILSTRPEINVKLPDNLCSGRAVDGDGFDWQTRTVGGELCCWQGCDHGLRKGARIESACHGYIVRSWLVSQSDCAGAGVR